MARNDCGATQERTFEEILPINMGREELDALFVSCMPRVRNVSRQILRNQQDCEDAVQEALLLAFRKLRQFQGRSKFSTWLHTVVRNSTLVSLRKSKAHMSCSLEEPVEGTDLAVKDLLTNPEPGPEERYEWSERSAILLRVLEQMPARYQSAVQLCDLKGLDIKEAAQRLGMTLPALKVCLFRARKMATRRVRERLAGRQDVLPACERDARPTRRSGSPDEGRAAMKH